MKKQLIVFILLISGVILFAQSTSIDLTVDYWRSLSQEAKLSFVHGFVMGSSMAKLDCSLESGIDPGTMPIDGKEEDFVAYLDKQAGSIKDGSTRLIFPFAGLFKNIPAYMQGKSIIAAQASWLSIKLDPDSFSRDANPSFYILPSIKLYDDFRESVFRLDGPDLSSVIYFEAKIENDLIKTISYSGWNFAVCMEHDIGKKVIGIMGNIPADTRLLGYELKNAKIQIYKIAYQKTWLIVIRDWE